MEQSITWFLWCPEIWSSCTLVLFWLACAAGTHGMWLRGLISHALHQMRWKYRFTKGCTIFYSVGLTQHFRNHCLWREFLGVSRLVRWTDTKLAISFQRWVVKGHVVHCILQKSGHFFSMNILGLAMDSWGWFHDTWTQRKMQPLKHANTQSFLFSQVKYWKQPPTIDLKGFGLANINLVCSIT